MVAYELAWLWRVVEPGDTSRESPLLAKVLKVPTQVPAATDGKAAAYQTTMTKRAAKRLRDFRNRYDLRLVLGKNAVDAAWRIIARGGGGGLPHDMRLR